jgi:hypothetical protein
VKAARPDIIYMVSYVMDAALLMSQSKELDINPLLASPEQLIALDARVVLHGQETTEAQLPKLAIRQSTPAICYALPSLS